MGVFGWMALSVIALGYGSRLCADTTGANATIEIKRTVLNGKLDTRLSIHCNQAEKIIGQAEKLQAWHVTTSLRMSSAAKCSR